MTTSWLALNTNEQHATGHFLLERRSNPSLDSLGQRPAGIILVSGIPRPLRPILSHSLVCELVGERLRCEHMLGGCQEPKGRPSVMVD